MDTIARRLGPAPVAQEPLEQERWQPEWGAILGSRLQSLLLLIELKLNLLGERPICFGGQVSPCLNPFLSFTARFMDAHCRLGISSKAVASVTRQRCETANMRGSANMQRLFAAMLHGSGIPGM